MKKMKHSRLWTQYFISLIIIKDYKQQLKYLSGKIHFFIFATNKWPLKRNDKLLCRKRRLLKWRIEPFVSSGVFISSVWIWNDCCTDNPFMFVFSINDLLRSLKIGWGQNNDVHLYQIEMIKWKCHITAWPDQI